MTTTAVKPRYTHDCTACVFLGHYDTEEEGEFDLYACTAQQVGGGGSFIGRYGNEGYEYASAPANIASRSDYFIKSVVEAYRRWQRLDHINDTIAMLGDLHGQLQLQVLEEGICDPCDLLGQMTAEKKRLLRRRAEGLGVTGKTIDELRALKPGDRVHVFYAKDDNPEYERTNCEHVVAENDGKTLWTHASDDCGFPDDAYPWEWDLSRWDEVTLAVDTGRGYVYFR